MSEPPAGTPLTEEELAKAAALDAIPQAPADAPVDASDSEDGER